MRRSFATAVAAVAGLAPAAPASAVEYRNGSVYARVTAGQIVLGNELAERRWSRSPFRTTALVDKREGGKTWSGPSRDFRLALAGAELGSELFDVESVRVRNLPGGGLRLEIEAATPSGLPHAMSVTRTVEAYPGIAGFWTQTTLRSLVPLVLTGATLDEAAIGAVEPTSHAFRGGADWREPDWPGPPLSFGDSHPGT